MGLRTTTTLTTLLSLFIIFPTTNALRETYQIIDTQSPTTWDHIHYKDPLYDRTGAFYNGYLFLNWSYANASTSSCPQDQSRIELWHAVAWIGPPANSSDVLLDEQNPFALWIVAWPPTEEFKEEMREKYDWPNTSQNQTDNIQEAPKISNLNPSDNSASGSSNPSETIPLETPNLAHLKHKNPPTEYIANPSHLKHHSSTQKFFPFEYDTALYGWEINSHSGAPEIVSELYTLMENPLPVPFLFNASTPPQTGPPNPPPGFGPQNKTIGGVDDPLLNLTTYGFKLLPHIPTRAYEDITGELHTDMLKPDAFGNHILHRSRCPNSDRLFKTTITVDRFNKAGTKSWGTGFDEGRFFSLTDDAGSSFMGAADGEHTPDQRKILERQRLHFGGDRRISFTRNAQTAFEDQFHERLKEYGSGADLWYDDRARLRGDGEGEELSVIDVRFDFTGWWDGEWSTNVPGFVRKEGGKELWKLPSQEFVWGRRNDAEKTIKERLEVVENGTGVVERVEEGTEDVKKNAAGRMRVGMGLGVLAGIFAVGIGML